MKIGKISCRMKVLWLGVWACYEGVKGSGNDEVQRRWVRVVLEAASDDVLGLDHQCGAGLARGGHDLGPPLVSPSLALYLAQNPARDSGPHLDLSHALATATSA
jgi:hypothetical protein